MTDIAATSALVLLVPIVSGALLGLLSTWFTRARFTGIGSAGACVLFPTLITTLATISTPIVGLWDGLFAGLLCGCAMLATAHQSLADWRVIVLIVGGLALGFILVEIATRLFMGPPPVLSIADGPHLLMPFARPNTTSRLGPIPTYVESWLATETGRERFTSSVVSNEVICSIGYGDPYKPYFPVDRELAVMFPEPSAAPKPRVLHVGDSMVFGLNVPREQTFVADLQELEPTVEHINAGVPGVAPDDYFVVLTKWVERTRIDLAVMYLCAENDLSMDTPHPCSGGQSLLVYDDGQARLRFPDGPDSSAQIGLRWLAQNSPLPYLARVLIILGSRAAVFAARGIDQWSIAQGANDRDEQLQHLEAILRTSRDRLHAKNIRFVVVVLPSLGWIGVPNGPSQLFSEAVRDITTRLRVPELDATDLMRAAFGRGDAPRHEDGTHFSPQGHQLMATWLQRELAAYNRR